MPPDFAPMFVGSVFILVTGGVILLRPLTKRLGDLIGLMVEEKRRDRTAPPVADAERLMDILEGIENRLSRLEERQQFTDAMLSSGQRPPISAPASPPKSPAG